MGYIDDEENRITLKRDKNGLYFNCLNCGKIVYEDDVEETDKWWDNEGNHRMIYRCPHCEYDNYE